jgi:hypothetical protein
MPIAAAGMFSAAISAMTDPNSVSDAPIGGKAVWIEMDQDKSAITFSRKGVVVRGYEKPLEKEAWIVALGQPPLMLFPFPRRLHNVILQYKIKSTHGLNMTFRTGVSYAEVLRIRRKEAMTRETLTHQDVSRIGGAFVCPWPKPEDRTYRLVKK